jgi:hypothetical protein
MELVALWLVSMAVFGAGMAALAWRRLQVRNRVSPRISSRAPLDWMWSWSLAARLHRHLARTVAAARSCIQGSRAQLGLEDLVAGLERHACAIDDQLVVVARLPASARRRLLRELAAEVREVDALAERVIRSGRAWAGVEPSTRALAPVAERLDALDEAMRDLSRLDRASGGADDLVIGAEHELRGGDAAGSSAEPAGGSGLGDGDEAVEYRRRPPIVD